MAPPPLFQFAKLWDLSMADLFATCKLNRNGGGEEKEVVG